jgi:hypothetical protein
MNISANFEAINLVGEMGMDKLGNGLTASTVHQIFCLGNGSITITPMLGDSFTWNATSGQHINVVTKAVNVSSGTFIGFKAKHHPVQFF